MGRRIQAGIGERGAGPEMVERMQGRINQN